MTLDEWEASLIDLIHCLFRDLRAGLVFGRLYPMN